MFHITKSLPTFCTAVKVKYIHVLYICRYTVYLVIRNMPQSAAYHNYNRTTFAFDRYLLQI